MLDFSNKRVPEVQGRYGTTGFPHIPCRGELAQAWHSGPSCCQLHRRFHRGSMWQVHGMLCASVFHRAVPRLALTLVGGPGRGALVLAPVHDLRLQLLHHLAVGRPAHRTAMHGQGGGGKPGGQGGSRGDHVFVRQGGLGHRAKRRSRVTTGPSRSPSLGPPAVTVPTTAC